MRYPYMGTEYAYAYFYSYSVLNAGYWICISVASSSRCLWFIVCSSHHLWLTLVSNRTDLKPLYKLCYYHKIFLNNTYCVCIEINYMHSKYCSGILCAIKAFDKFCALLNRFTIIYDRSGSGLAFCVVNGFIEARLAKV